MPAVPKHREVKITRHEWVIGNDSSIPLDAKDFEYGLHSAKQSMESLGVKLNFDDAYHVRAGDGSEVILYVETETDAFKSLGEQLRAGADHVALRNASVDASMLASVFTLYRKAKKDLVQTEGDEQWVALASFIEDLGAILEPGE
jgi:hypothetical protein